MNCFDFDGVICESFDSEPLIMPDEWDVIITGRCFDESDLVLKYLQEHGIFNAVYFNPVTLNHRGNHTERSRTLAALHKISILEALLVNNSSIDKFFEDDPLQYELIKTKLGHLISVVKVDSKVKK